MSAPGPTRAAKKTRDDWETPPALFDALNREFRFTLDAAANADNRKCERYLTEEEDALEVDIFDQVVWCNPPYGRGLKEWVVAFADWSLAGSTVVALLPANTDTEWFKIVWFWSHEIRFLAGRVNFVGSSSGNTGGSMVVVFRPQPPQIRLVSKGESAGFVVSNYVPPRVSLWDWRAGL